MIVSLLFVNIKFYAKECLKKTKFIIKRPIICNETNLEY